MTGATDDVVPWLLEGDPAIRWQVLRDLLDAPADEVAGERARVEHEGWGARLLAHQDEDGRWDAGAWGPAGFAWGDEPGQPWTATLPVLQTLELLGLPGDCASAQRTAGLVAASCRWEYDELPFFDGEVDTCINARVVTIGTWLGVDVRPVVDRLLAERLADGGWNCEWLDGATVSSIDTTANVVEGLAAYERSVGGDPAVATARTAGEEYLLERRLFRRRTTGQVADPDFLLPAFPFHWRHDVLRALDHLRAVDRRDDRAAEAVAVVRGLRGGDGRWPLSRVPAGREWFRMEEVGAASRWITLRALRVLRWWDAA